MIKTKNDSMKNALFLILFLLGSITINAKSYDVISFTVTSKNSTDGGIYDDTDTDNFPSSRSLIPLRIYAYLYNNVVSISFDEVFPVVSISIVNDITGEILYLEQHNFPNQLYLSLDNKNSGDNFRIEIETDKVLMRGFFSF